MEYLISSVKINQDKIFNDSELNNINSYILLQGGKQKIRNNDVEYYFRQDSNFFWLSGIDKPDYQIAINCYEKKIILITPKFDDNFLIWNGSKPNFNFFKNCFNFTKVTDDIDEINIDEQNLLVNQKLLLNTIEKYRIIKNKFEIKLMKLACNHSQDAHNYLINNINKYINNSEKIIEKKFKYLTETKDDVLNQAYPPICANGKNSAILHYNDNNNILESGRLFLIDAGCELFNYASDITRTYGIGEINKYQKNLINVVTYINTQCKLLVKDNIDFKEIHMKCMDLIYQGILSLNIIKEDSINNKDLISSIFMPHGLGHFIGLDVHDVGGRLYNKKTNESVILKENMVITIEPGIYFNNYLLEKYENIFTDEINNYKDIGGVRIEDVVVVKKETYQQLN